MSFFGNTPPSSPLASTYAGLPPDIDDWSCGQWKEYYQKNKSALGQAKAKSIINTDMANTNSFTTNAQWCKYDCDWVRFFAAEGLQTGNIFSKSYCAADSVVTAVENTADVASNLTSGVAGFTKSKIVSIGIVAGLGYLAVKTFYPQALKKLKR